MTDDQRTALRLQTAMTRAIIGALGMQAENDQRRTLGLSMAYDDVAFNRILHEEGLTASKMAAI